MWTVHPIGRLGNLMGEYATLYALAKLNGHQAYVLPGMHSQLSKIFKIKLPVIHQEVANRIKWKNYGLHDWMSPEYSNIKGEYVKLSGYPCSWTFYDHIKDEILQEFTFHDFIVEETNAFLSRVRGDKKNVTFVGVHVRRGDYVNVMPKAWKGVVADKSYFQKAMDYFRKKYDNSLFVVTSNDMNWCKKNINNSLEDVHFAGDGKEGSPGRDFAILAHCNHTIMSIGTFGFWVGYIVGGETVFLSNFTLPDSPFLRVFKYKAAYLPHWVGIPADLSPILNKERSLSVPNRLGALQHQVGEMPRSRSAPALERKTESREIPPPPPARVTTSERKAGSEEIHSPPPAHKMNRRLVCAIINFILMLVIINISYFYNSGRKAKITKAPCSYTKGDKSMNQKQTESKMSAIPSHHSSSVMWTFYPINRLGNLMGEYATLYALAKLNGHQAYVMPEMHSKLSGIFKLKLPVINQGVADRIQWKSYKLQDWMSTEYYNISGQYVKLFGTPCSWTFYHHIKEEIVQEFTFHDIIKEESNAYLFKLRGDKENVTFVGVHVRRGDYVHIMPNQRKGVVADKSYLQKAMYYFRKKYENPLFVVTSNDMHWCKENIDKSRGDVHFAGDGNEGSPSRDFALLVHCNHTIMTIGTFGYWAAYLAGGETIYLTNFTLPDSPYLRIFRYEAAFLPEWIGIPADLSPLLKNGNS
ncbi:uncharacterized protein WCC33_011631 [Rhinophrynus dorsalis]